nr:hypothetical protein [uncultured Tolumonas sp.]
MINLNKDSPVWLIDRCNIGEAFSRAARKVYESYVACDRNLGRGSSLNKLNRALEIIPTSSFSELSDEDVEKILTWTYRGVEAKHLEIKNDRFFRILPYHIPPLINFFKLCFIQLWIDKKFLAPLKMTLPNKIDVELDTICIKSNLDTLITVRKVSKYSQIPYESTLSLLERERKSSHWLRLLVSTTFYSHKNLNEDDCLLLFNNGVGHKEQLLGRYYVTDFMLSLAQGHANTISIVEKITSSYQSNIIEQRSKRHEEKEAQKSTYEEKKEANEKVRQKRLEAKQSDLIGFATANSNLTFDYILNNHLTIIALKKIYYIESSDIADHFLYSKLPLQVQQLVKVISSTYLGFVKAKRLQNDKNYRFMLGVLLSYISTYLPNFYFSRDGNLDDFPTTLNSFSCSIFVTRNAIFESDELISPNKKLPITFLAYLNKFRDIGEWGNDTLYSRIKCIELYFSYLVENKHFLPIADRVSCTFSPACYPKTIKKDGTVKKTIPRAYFSAYLSMLYALEYLVTHINGIADGTNYAILNGKMYQPSLAELQEHHQWIMLWGKRGNNYYNQVDLSLLNYTPIFYYEGKAYPLKFVPRFYRILPYEFNGVTTDRVVPNDIRILILMCETGIRQHHLVWLDQDQYDIALDKTIQSPLAPLFVSTDKAHGAWTSIVSRYLFPLLERQRDWNLSCTLPEYREKIWYGHKEGSKFGKFNPLFRLPSLKADIESDSSWKTYTTFKQTLLCLMYSIKMQFNDLDIDAFIAYKHDDKSIEQIDFKDFNNLKSLNKDQLYSKLTPHGLRASFVSEAVRFLPPSIVGEYFTGQTEQLVMFYRIFDPKNMLSHEQLLAQYLSENMDKLSNGEAPALAAAVLRVNEKLMADINKDPVTAIKTHRLISLTGIDKDKNGIELLKAKRFTALAYNSTHICPFNNTCPVEIVNNFGYAACAICPYAIRGIDHLPAISAEKDKAKEVMAGLLKQMEQYKNRKEKSVNKQELENLNKEYDFVAREAFCYEAIEQQLYKMAKAEDRQSFFLQNKSELINHWERINLTTHEHLIKRLIDVQNFPDMASSELDARFAYMRSALLVKQGNYCELLKISTETPCKQVTNQIASMLNAGELTPQDLFKISRLATEPLQLTAPESDVIALLGLKKD